ncbi:MAG: NADPH-dependent FMN reductase [Steroidobacteraceae bacterium]
MFNILAISGSLRPDSANTRLLSGRIRTCDGLLIASPEYAHGVPGVLKNALDWLVAGEEFVGKPVALFNASPRASHAQASLTETITTMSGRIISEAAAARSRGCGKRPRRDCERRRYLREEPHVKRWVAR